VYIFLDRFDRENRKYVHIFSTRGFFLGPKNPPHWIFGVVGVFCRCLSLQHLSRYISRSSHHSKQLKVQNFSEDSEVKISAVSFWFSIVHLFAGASFLRSHFTLPNIFFRPDRTFLRDEDLTGSANGKSNRGSSSIPDRLDIPEIMQCPSLEAAHRNHDFFSRHRAGWWKMSLVPSKSQSSSTRLVQLFTAFWQLVA
jgi:hypothetical protein